MLEISGQGDLIDNITPFEDYDVSINGAVSLYSELEGCFCCVRFKGIFTLKLSGAKVVGVYGKWVDFQSDYDGWEASDFYDELLDELQECFSFREV